MTVLNYESLRTIFIYNKFKGNKSQHFAQPGLLIQPQTNAKTTSQAGKETTVNSCGKSSDANKKVIFQGQLLVLGKIIQIGHFADVRVVKRIIC